MEMQRRFLEHWSTYRHNLEFLGNMAIYELRRGQPLLDLVSDDEMTNVSGESWMMTKMNRGGFRHPAQRIVNKLVAAKNAANQVQTRSKQVLAKNLHGSLDPGQHLAKRYRSLQYQKHYKLDTMYWTI